MLRAAFCAEVHDESISATVNSISILRRLFVSRSGGALCCRTQRNARMSDVLRTFCSDKPRGTRSMLRIIRLMGMTLFAMLALGGVASGHNFKSSVAGNFKAVSNQSQLFLIVPSGDMVTCTKDAIVKGTDSSGLQLSILVEYEYTGCTVEIFGLQFAATVSLARWAFSADNELVKLENLILINVPIAKCNIHILPQHLKAVLYKNNGKKIVVEPHASKIASQGSGGECGGASTVTYTGNTEVEVVGGEISWS
jgi:hypothetical protein